MNPAGSASPSQDSHQHDEQAEPSGSASKQERRYGFACVGCKRRKARCNGVQPECARCARLKEPCVWPTVSVSKSGASNELLFNQLRDARQFLERLTSLPEAEQHSLLQEIAHDPPTWSRLQTSDFRTSEQEEGGFSDGEGVAGRENPFDLPTEHSEKSPASTTERGVAELLHHMSLNEKGSFQHYGSSSLFYQKPPETLLAREVLARLAREQAERGNTPTDESFEPQPDWRMLAYNCQCIDQLVGESENAVRTWQLLTTFFTWNNPEFHIVNESVFYRDMALSGPYFSRFLLCSICAHASRYSDAELSLPPQTTSSNLASGSHHTAISCGTDFLKEAKQLLMGELEKPTSIPTITGLMILGQRECECGNTSLAWLYIGMAWRMLRDLGLHLASRELSIYGGVGLPAEDQEIRLRLFWSAFALDKCISVALGRSPTFNAYQRLRPSFITDLSGDEDLWAPLSVNGNSLPVFATYQPQKSFIMSTAKAMASLTTIASDILMRFYVKKPALDQEFNFLDECDARLKNLFASWPPALQLTATHLPTQCPPPHIVSLNLLYRAILILLYRPFIDESGSDALPPSVAARLSQAQDKATDMAIQAHSLMALHRTTFSWLHLSYTMLYSCYAAASIDVLDFLSKDARRSSAAVPRLSMSLKVLEQGAYQSPALMQTLVILKTKLRERHTRTKRSRTGVEMETWPARRWSPHMSDASQAGLSHAGQMFAGGPPAAVPQAPQISTSGIDVFPHQLPASIVPNQDVENFWGTEGPSPALQDMLSLPMPSTRMPGDNQHRGQAQEAPNSFLRGDAFGSGSIMPMGLMWDFENEL